MAACVASPAQYNAASETVGELWPVLLLEGASTPSSNAGRRATRGLVRRRQRMGGILSHHYRL